MLTSSPFHTDTYPASANLPPLIRDLLANSGTMFTVRTGSLTLCSSIAMVVAGLGCTSTSAKILVYIRFVCMNCSPTITVWDVHTVYHAAEGISPSSTPSLEFCSVSSVCLWYVLCFVHGWRRYAALSLYMWFRGRANCTLGLLLLSPCRPSLISYK